MSRPRTGAGRRSAAFSRAGRGSSPLPRDVSGDADVEGVLEREEQIHPIERVDAKIEEGEAKRRLFLLQVIQPGLVGLMDGSVSTLAPLV